MRDYPSDRVDLRSDTVTQPTQDMRKAMATATVGDDVLGDDPTVIELQNRVAQMLGKDAALFVPSGTMSNAVAIKTQTRPGDEIVTHRKSHIYMYEAGGYAVLAGCSISLVDGEMGQMSPENVQKAIRKVAGSDSHYPECTLICVENTANVGGGSVYDQETLDAICEVAHKNDCRAHLDGARMFNAVVTSGTDPARMVRDFDTISICLSKGLGAPVGSVLVGDESTISEAHRWRKMFGGGMRQAGVLAAAGLYALENNIDRLVDDHARARRLAEAVNAMDAYSVDIEAVQSNMVYVDCSEGGAKALVQNLASMGVDVLDLEDSTIRAVVHLHITDEGIDRAIAAFETAQ
ncbi:MAG: GntG family PLP-dependent aldolase [Candidatus Thermoplasmatota archaeon]|nr:GntG family PLP-dependent aldolase [Candidatus Thermoplasmatota archaeon]